MAAEETLPYARSSSRAPRIVQDASHEQRSFFGHKSGKKSQQRAASDKLVWFSPVHSPLLSPAREKTLPTTKKKVRNSSIFSIQSKVKGSIEAEEPTSPKVSCIGQVRAYKKDKDVFADSIKKKISTCRPGSMSPARFFTSPGRTSRWGSLFGSRKDPCATASSSGYGGDYQPKNQDTCAAVDDYFDRYAHGAADSDVLGEACPLSAANCSISLKKGASGSEKSYDLDVHEKHNDGSKSIKHVDPNDAIKHTGAENAFQERQGRVKNPDLRQRLTYEELPSLHCGTSIKPNMKISVEVVPETWLSRNGESSRPDTVSHLHCAPEKTTSTCREDLENAQKEEIKNPVSPCNKAQQDTRERKECEDYQVSQNAHVVNKPKFVPVDAGLVPVYNTECKPLHLGSERKVNTQIEASATTSSCTTMGACKETYGEHRSSGDEEGANKGQQLGKQQSLHGEKLEGEFDVEKHQILLGSTELKNRHRRLRRVGPHVGKENYDIVLPPILDKKLPSVNPTEDGNHLWSIFKDRKSDGFPVQPFSALILVGYDQPVASKDSVKKITPDEELVKGILEVGRLSFHGSGKYFQVLKGDAAFIRSRSATSYRTVITLQRCNSDPCRSSC